MSINVKKLLEAIGKLADNEHNSKEMLRGEKILYRLIQNLIEKLMDDNNTMATRIRDFEITLESQRNTPIKYSDHGLNGCKGDSKHLNGPREVSKNKTNIYVSLTGREQ